jgi:molybdenum cofactor synthesis domain-containing protein
MYKIGIIVVSDKGYSGERTDKSGKVIHDTFTGDDFEIAEYKIVPDEREIISESLCNLADQLGIDLIFTSGGTGMSPRDITPEATLDVIDRLVPGIPEAMRQKSLEITSRAMLSRAVAGIRDRTLIINLPGSPKAVKECLDVISPVLLHGMEILKGQTGECAR